MKMPYKDNMREEKYILPSHTERQDILRGIRTNPTWMYLKIIFMINLNLP